MTLYESLLLGLIQGITEFLPISSSGHLVLMQNYLNMRISPLVLQNFDIVLHAGSLIAILFYFRSTWLRMVLNPLNKENDGSPPLLFVLIIATIPAGVIGILTKEWIAMNTQTPIFVAFGFIFTGAFLIASGWYESRFASKESFGWKQSIGAGLGQALAILPGFSRSGLTIASGRLMGLSITRSTEFAFLMGAPVLFGALILSLGSGLHGLAAIGWPQLFIGFTTALTSSLLVIHFFIHTIRRYGIWMWAAYLFVASSLIIADEMLPFISELARIGDTLELRIIVGVLFITLLLESAPFTSIFAPGFSTLVIIGVLLKHDPWSLAACIPIGTIALLLGNLLGYIPARQARLQVRWSETADSRLTRAQHLFKKWGILAVFFGGWYGPTRMVMSIAAGLSNMQPIPYILTATLGSLAWISLVLFGSASVAQAMW